MCCGRKRQAMMASYGPSGPTLTRRGMARTPRAAHAVNVGVGRSQGITSAINLRYVHTASIRVQGSVTGRQYDFSGERPVQVVHAGDAPALLQTGYFRRT